jgi:hypothetical protein
MRERDLTIGGDLGQLVVITMETSGVPGCGPCGAVRLGFHESFLGYVFCCQYQKQLDPCALFAYRDTLFVDVALMELLAGRDRCA